MESELRANATSMNEPEPSSHEPMLIPAKEAAERLSLSVRKLWSLTQCRALPSRRIGRSVRYSPVELHAWITAGCPTEPGAADRIRTEAQR